MISAATRAAITAGRLSPDGPPIGQVSPAAPRRAPAPLRTPPGARSARAWSPSRSARHRRRRRGRAPRPRSGSRARGRGSAPRRPRPAPRPRPPPRAAASAGSRRSRAASASSSARWSISTGRTGSSASAAASARPTWPAPKISTSRPRRRLRRRAGGAAPPARPRRAASAPASPGRRSTGRSRGRAARPAARARAPRRSSCAGAVDRHVFELAAADRAGDAVGRDEHPGARPRAASSRPAATSTSTAGGPAAPSDQRSTARAASAHAPPRFGAQPLDRHQHALGRRRRVEARRDPVVGDGGHRHRQRLEHRDRQHERRLADRLRAVDRRLAVLRPVGELDVEDRAAGRRRAGSCRSRARGCAAGPWRPTTAPRWSASPCPG